MMEHGSITEYSTSATDDKDMYYYVPKKEIETTNISIRTYKEEGNKITYQAFLLKDQYTILSSECKQSIYHAVEDLKNKYNKYVEAVHKLFEIEL